MPVRITGVNGTEWAYVTTYVNEGGTADNSVPFCRGIGVIFIFNKNNRRVSGGFGRLKKNIACYCVI